MASTSSSFKVFNLNEKSRVEIRKIIVVGNDRTKLDFFQHELNNVCANSVVTNGSIACQLPFATVYQNLHLFTNRMLSSDLFEACDTNLQIDHFNAEENKYEVRP